MYFQELTQLRQKGSLESYVVEFQRLVVMVTDLSMTWLIMLFVEGLLEPL